MADIALTTADKVEVVGAPVVQHTLQAVEAVVAGAPVRQDTDGKWTNANGTTTTEANAYGIVTASRAAGEYVTAIRKGRLDGYNLSALAYGDPVFLSDTVGRISSTPGTQNVQIGIVVSRTGTTLGTANDKILEVDFPPIGATTAANTPKVLTTELLAASVDKWLYVADRAYQVVLVEEIHSVVGGSSAAVRPRKITAATTAAPGAAVATGITEITAASIDLTAAINVTQTPALSATAADLLLADGDKIGLDFSGTLTGLVGQLIIHLKPV
jgi:hypothetical protein